jgi:integrase
MKLTKRTIDAITPDPRRDIYVWDDEVRGFLLRVKPSGVRSFAIQYRNASGVSRRITIGKLGVLTADEARKVAKQKLADVTRGGDPAETRWEDRKTMTVRQLCRAYVNACEKGLIMGKRGRPKKASTLYVDRGRIERHILPLLGGRRLRDLRAPDIVRFMRDVAAGKTANDIKTGFRGRAIIEGGPGTAARTVGLLGGILSFAVSEGIIPTNPVRGVRRPADQRREVRLTNEQYGMLGKALAVAEAEGENPLVILGVRLLALTGCRRGEIERLRWDEVDIAGGCLRLADSKEGKSVRPLGSAATKLLARLPRDSSFVVAGASSDRPFTGLPKAWPRILKRANLPNLTPHGLRHAFASMASDLGYTEPTIAAMLGHAAHSTTGRYIHHLDSALVASADRVSSRISAALNAEGKEGKEVSLRRNRRRATP